MSSPGADTLHRKDARAPIRLVHVICSTDPGGAEYMLERLVRVMDSKRFHNEVISLTNLGEVGNALQRAGVAVHVVGLHRRWPNPLSVVSLSRLIRRLRPDIVQTWMYHANLLGSVAARLAGVKHIVWNIRHSDLGPGKLKWRTQFSIRLGALLSHLISARIVCNSSRAMEVHRTLGYDDGKFLMIANGFEVDRFSPDPAARVSLRKELGLPSDTFLIGLIARFTGEKDHPTFIRAASVLLKKHPRVRFLLCGKDIDTTNEALAAWLSEAGIRDNVHLLDLRHDMPRINAALDIATSSSLSEGFPNALGEAMSCGIACVATAAGQSATLLDRTGRTTPVGDAEALAAGWAELIEMGDDRRRALGTAARERIVERFSMAAIARRYENLYEEILGNDRSH